MKALLTTVAAAASLMVAAQAGAAVDMEAGKALAQKSGCLACHSVDKKIIGPAYKDVAAKYKGDKTAEAKLVEKVKKGGSGVWGPMPMPANSPQVKDEDIKTLVEWVLAH
jgi:cytochrome c